MTYSAADPSVAVSSALAALRAADSTPWVSDAAAAFRLQLDAVERLVVAIGYRVECAEDGLGRLAAA